MPFDILLFAGIAIFFFWKLRQTLGTRTGEERERQNPFAAPPEGQDRGQQDETRSVHNVGPEPVIEGAAREVPLAGRPLHPLLHPEASVAGGLAQLHAADPDFDEKSFLTRARQAYTLIVEAFAEGDRATLKMLLAADVYDGFGAELDARAARGETLRTELKRILVAEISMVRCEGRRGTVTVDFTSEQISATTNRAGEVTHGDTVRPLEVAEAWSFARDLDSRDPVWRLTGTRLL